MTDPNNPEVLRSVATEIEAAAIVGALNTHGIEATTTGGHTANFRAEAPGSVNVIVRHSDLERAAKVLDELAQQPPTE